MLFRKGSGDGSWENVIGTTSLQADTWYHVAGAYNGSVMSVFVNGLSDVSPYTPDTQGVSYAHSTGLSVGYNPIGANPSNEYFKGSIRDVRIWRVARTQAEIAGNMNVVLQTYESELVGYWNPEQRAPRAGASGCATGSVLGNLKQVPPTSGRAGSSSFALLPRLQPDRPHCGIS